MSDGLYQLPFPPSHPNCRGFIHWALGDSIHWALGDSVRVHGVPGIPEGKVYAVGGEVSINGRVDQGVEIRDWRLEAENHVKPKCRCGADAWIEGSCAKCFRASKGIGQNEFVLHRADGVWVVAGSSPQLTPGDEVASARGLAGLTKDGVPWVEGTASGRRWGQDAKTGDLLGGREYRHRQHEDGSYTIEESLDGADWSVVHSVCGGCGAV